MSDRDNAITWTTQTSFDTLRAVEAGPDPLLVARELQKECAAQPEGEIMEIPAEQLSRILLEPLIAEIERLREYRKAAERYMRAKERMMPMPWEWVQQEYDEAEAQLTAARAATAPR